MNKQSIGILLNRVGLSICIGMLVLLIACQESVSSSGSNNVTTKEPYTKHIVDTALRVESVAIKDTVLSGKVYEADEKIRVKVIFTERVGVTGKPKIKITVGNVEKDALYASGGDTTKLIFEYTVVPEDTEAGIESITIKEDSLALNGGTIKDKAGNDIGAITFSAVTIPKLGKSKALVIHALKDNPIVPGTISKYPVAATGTFSIDPELPDGLAINEDTGEISGTPTTVTVTKDSDDEYTVTFTGMGGVTNAKTNIIVRVYKYKPVNKGALKTAIATEINSQGNEADLNYIDTSAIKDMGQLFLNQGAFNGHLSKWDVSQVTDMEYMFLNTYVFNKDISGWDVS